jgi:hypothetical protein
MVEQGNLHSLGGLSEQMRDLHVCRARRRVARFTKSGPLGYERTTDYQRLTQFMRQKHSIMKPLWSFAA